MRYKFFKHPVSHRDSEKMQKCREANLEKTFT